MKITTLLKPAVAYVLCVDGKKWKQTSYCRIQHLYSIRLLKMLRFFLSTERNMSWTWKGISCWRNDVVQPYFLRSNESPHVTFWQISILKKRRVTYLHRSNACGYIPMKLLWCIVCYVDWLRVIWALLEKHSSKFLSFNMNEKL